ncbi:hypothetical protein ABZV65_30325 [Streptomyces bauhiniae]|uniref:hypothetical protein n=1 Tax=Streptomyces bauhiniae TaxID=2340725 RepID=UPI0033AFF8A3
MAKAVLPEVRAAQRRVVSTVRVSGVLNGDGLALWREAGCGEWKATAAEIGRDLELLEVPHEIVMAGRFPLANSRSTQLRRGEEVRVARNDLTHLVRWMPSLKGAISNIPGDCPGWGFTIFQPRAEGIAVMGFALAADWPAWTQKQARAARLLCAECGYDLRRRDEEGRRPFMISLPEKPKALRLVCGRCCNEGLDEMERLAALAGKSA